MKKLHVAILGGTGMVGQRFIQLLENHPWFEVTTIVASPQSAGKTYEDAVRGRWSMNTPIPKYVGAQYVVPLEIDMKKFGQKVDLAFSALDMEKDEIKHIEETYAAYDIPVISNNSAHRWTDDVPMIIPEVNPEHASIIDFQRKNRGWKKGFIAVKPNCSIQSYVGILTAFKDFQPQKVHVVSLQAISGAGKTFETWSEMRDNVIPYISGEEEKSEKEPLKIWGNLEIQHIVPLLKPEISATCIRVPISHGHMASVSVSFAIKPSKEQLLDAIQKFNNTVVKDLPSSPKQYIHYHKAEDRPQTKVDRDFENGMGLSMGRLQKDKHFDWKFIALSHNTIRGAAGGAILMAELLVKKGYIV